MAGTRKTALERETRTVRRLVFSGYCYFYNFRNIITGSDAMNTSVISLVSALIKREGGYVNNPSDRGGPTKFGITIPTYADYFGHDASQVKASEIFEIPESLATSIYLKLFYVRPGINHLPDLLRPIVFDMAANHGPRLAVKILQRALEQHYYSVGIADGIIGTKTIAAANKATEDLGVSLINILVNFRLAFYKEIISNDPTQKVFEKGWLARAESFRVELV
jgi:lysozyme family protein